MAPEVAQKRNVFNSCLDFLINRNIAAKKSNTKDKIKLCFHKNATLNKEAIASIPVKNWPTNCFTR